MSNILTSLSNLIKSCLGGNPPPPTKISDLGQKLEELTSLNLDASGEGIDIWINKFQEIIGDIVLRETLLVRTLQMNLPRVAEFLTMLGIIRFQWVGIALAIRPPCFDIKSGIK